jgi:hypothetical protein
VENENNKSLILGIDPGLKGAYAFFSSQTENIVQLGKMPLIPKGRKFQIDAHQMAKDIKNSMLQTRFAVIEHVAARPGQGVVSMFTFGQTMGIVQGMVAAFQIPIVFVDPQAWKTPLQLSSDKYESRLMASKIFPGLDFSKVSDDGRAEACLLAVYGALYHEKRFIEDAFSVPRESERMASNEKKRSSRPRNGPGKNSGLN